MADDGDEIDTWIEAACDDGWDSAKDGWDLLEIDDYESTPPLKADELKDDQENLAAWRSAAEFKRVVGGVHKRAALARFSIVSRWCAAPRAMQPPLAIFLQRNKLDGLSRMSNRRSAAVNGWSCTSPKWEADMMPESEVTFRMVDRRHSANAGESGARRDIPDGYRPHAVLLGYHSEDQAREFLRDQAVHPDAVGDLMAERARARSRIRTLEPFAAASATLPVEDPQAIAEIRRIMAQPECRAAFPEGTWTAELVEIAKLIPIHPSLDVRYAESLGGESLDPSQPLSALQLCFAAKHASPFHFSVDHAQKSVNIAGIHPAFEVVSLRAGQQGEDGPLIVSFMVAAPPNVVVVLRHAGRLFLSGGRHRVYRLMQAAFSHVPCVVRDAPGLPPIAAYGPQFFQEPVLVAPRPPLFADFADPELASLAPLRAMHKVIRIRPDEYLIAS